MASSIRAGEQYVFINAASNTAIDLANGSSTPDTRVQGWNPAWNVRDIRNQIWIIEPQSDSWYKIRNRASWTCMDLENGSNDPGTHIRGMPDRDYSAQQWSFRKVGSRIGYPVAW